MGTDNSDILDLLVNELGFLESGGYGQSVRTPWRSKSTFEDSPSCINYAGEKTHPCAECRLIDFVPHESRGEHVPCHYIPLNEAGETLSDLESKDNQAKLERVLKQWLLARIEQLGKTHEAGRTS